MVCLGDVAIWIPKDLFAPFGALVARADSNTTAVRPVCEAPLRGTRGHHRNLFDGG